MRKPVSSILGRLHDPHVIQQFKAMQAPHDVIDYLTFGIPLVFSKDANFAAMNASNNASATKNKSFVTQTLLEWKKMGAVVEVPRHKAKIISPLSVAVKWDNLKRQKKYRLCLDGSRMKQDLCYHSVKLPDVNYLSSFLQPHDQIATVDMTK